MPSVELRERREAVIRVHVEPENAQDSDTVGRAPARRVRARA